MKALRNISTVLLFCLVLTASAAADELTLSSTSIYPGEAVTVTVVVQNHPEIRQGLVAAVRLTSTECPTEVKGQVPGAAEEHPLAKAGSYTFSLATSLYEALGTYRVCEYYLVKEEGETQASAQHVTTFSVIARPVPPPAPVVTPPTPAPIAAPSAPVVANPVVKPLTNLSKLRAACKKHKKHKRAKCVRKAKKHHR